MVHSVAPDQFASSDVCLGGRCEGHARSLPWVFPRFGGKGVCGHAFGVVGLGLRREQTCLVETE